MESRQAMFVPTETQVRVLDLLRRGMSNRAIADAVGISVPGVEYHLHRLFKATGTRNRVALVMWWMENRDAQRDDASRAV